MSWWKDLKGKIKLNEPLEKYTTFRIGGHAKYFVEPKDTDDLKLLLILLNRYKIKPFILGAGSNLLINDKGINGAVIRLNSPYFKKITFNKNNLEVDLGCQLSRVILLAKNYGLSGLESLIGIPGTIGGALVMNAGENRQGFSIGDIVDSVRVIDYQGRIKILNKNKINFKYRSSNLSEYIVLSAKIKLIRQNKQKIQQKIKEYLTYRKATQDLSRPSAGCIFKNPPGYSAGRLIDSCGLKGERYGNACISLRHANFIINLGNAKAVDVLKLMRKIKKSVKAKFNIDLEPEIKIW